MRKTSLEKQIADYVTTYKEGHYRLAYSYVENIDDALDIVQESIYKAMMCIEDLDNNKNIQSWFYGIIVNNSLDLLRMQRKGIMVSKKGLKFNKCDFNSIYQNIDLKMELEEIDIPRELEIVVENALRGSSLEDINEKNNFKRICKILYKHLSAWELL